MHFTCITACFTKQLTGKALDEGHEQHSFISRREWRYLCPEHPPHATDGGINNPSTSSLSNTAYDTDEPQQPTEDAISKHTTKTYTLDASVTSQSRTRNGVDLGSVHLHVMHLKCG